MILILIGLVACAAIIGSGTKGGGGSTTTTTTPESSSATSGQGQAKKAASSNQKQGNQKQEQDPNPHFGDGTFQVGKDIQSGTYRTRKGSSGCYYARLSGFGGQVGDILANDNTNAPAVVTIEPTDSGFESKRCGTWTQDLSQITTNKQSFGDGTYIVGTDIDPGTYKNDGSNGCYYARLSAFTGDVGSIIANDNTNASTVVTIAPTDTGFEAKRCGTWSKIE